MDRHTLGSSTSSRMGSRSSLTGNVFSPVTTNTALGKRGASDAGLDTADPAAVAKAYRELESKYNQLRRIHLKLEGVESKQKEEIDELKSQNEVLRQQRQLLADGEANERATSEAFDKTWAEERLKLHADLAEYRNRANRYRNTIEQYESDSQQTNAAYSQLQTSSSKTISTLESRIAELERERKDLKGYKSRSEALAIDLEEMRRKTQMGTAEHHDGVGSDGQAADQMLRKEIARQGKLLLSTKAQLDTAYSDLARLRQERDKSDKEWRAAKDTEELLRKENRMLHDQLERARREMDSLTQVFPTSSNTSEDYSTLQGRLTALSDLHNKATAELAAKDNEIISLQTRLSNLAQDSQSSLAALAKGKNDAERELRWAREGRQSAERREELAKRELELLRTAKASGFPGSSSGGDQSARVKELESLIDTYKAELEAISRDSQEVEERITQGAGLVKQSELESAQSRIAQLQTDITALESTISQLTSANNTLDAEVNDLMRRVASGEYNPATERCIELKSNPASQAIAIRKQMLEDLRAENVALITRLGVVDKAPAASGSEGEGLVPRQSYLRVVKEKEEMEQAHNKRLLRLKEIFGNKSKEFLEAVYSLLGWRIKFDESGADIRLTSMYAPKGKMGLTLKFASQEGHFGTMQMTGALSRGLEESRHFWIVERQSVPGFLAQVTTEMFEKTTIGRAAGYVGLD